MSDYRLIEAAPSVADYCRLRVDCGMRPKTDEAARIALPNSWYAVQIVCDGEAIAMGRIIGDGGCFFQVVDIGVLPQHRGRGLAKQVMAALLDHYDAHAPECAYLSLIADGEAWALYEQFGFRATAPGSIGMCRP